MFRRRQLKQMAAGGTRRRFAVDHDTPSNPFHLRDAPDNSPERTKQIERLVEKVVEERGDVIERLADE